jgi:uncharacterized membrane protein YtjA (UPF0391 family)
MCHIDHEIQPYPTKPLEKHEYLTVSDLLYTWGGKLSKESNMLRAAIAFFVLGLLSMLLGAYGVAGLSIDIGKMLLAIFLVFAVISFIASLVTGRKTNL